MQALVAENTAATKTWQQQKPLKPTHGTNLKVSKNTSLEAQKDLLIALTKTGAIQKDYATGVDSFITKLEKKIRTL
ncbi:MAG: hypothetical protein KatS3mg035_0455 [Bacteroidia bacterium]|nr:MAG: hypothetical protein KatS3mg035_0455 [Bacteroidia bacterium]